MNILAIETSFDETAAAIVANGKTVLSNVTATSNLLHRKYGGVVPEVAARKQVESMIPVLTEVMQGMTPQDVDALAVTVGPGLIGSLLIGVETAKTLAVTWNKPIVPVNHVLAHMYVNFLTSSSERENSSRAKSRDILFPAISLVVSGGHTELYLMKNPKDLKWLGGTLDDAAGEAFDKSARLLGFGNKGGAAIEQTAIRHSERSEESRPKAEKNNASLDSSVSPRNDIQLPRPMLHDNSLNFSFSGLKTALLREVSRLKVLQQLNNKATCLPAGKVQQLAFEVQEAITDVLVTKTIRAVKQYNARSVLISGGVAANKRLAAKFRSAIKQLNNVTIVVPPVSLCTDNAVMIAACAHYLNNPVPWQEVTARPDLSVEV